MSRLNPRASETHLMSGEAPYYAEHEEDYYEDSQQNPYRYDDQEELAQFSLDEDDPGNDIPLGDLPASAPTPQMRERANRLSSSSSALPFVKNTAANRSSGSDDNGGNDEDDADRVDSNVVQFTAQQAYKHAEATKREIWSWVAYDWANSVYSSVSIVLLIPLLLDTLAFGAGFNPDDMGPCLPANTTLGTEQKCRVPFGAGTVDSTAYSLYMVAISVGIQALLFISLGSLADYGKLRKRLMMAFAFFGAVFTILFLVPTSETLWLAGLLTVLSNACFGVSIVFYNAFLPLLVEAHPEMRKLASSGTPVEVEEISRVSQEVSNKLSTSGYVAGYISGTLLLLVCVGIILAMGQDSTTPMKLGIALSGIWWACFTLFPAAYLKERAGPPLPKGQFWLFLSWRQVFNSFRSFRKIPRTFIFLISYFIFSDAYSTISSVAVLFGRRDLHMDNTKLVIIAIVVPFSAFIGNLLFLFVQRLLKADTKRMLVAILVLLALIPAYGLLGLASDSFGLRTEGEMYALGVYYGLLLGPVQSYSRVFFAELIPPGQEAEFFGLYEITDKGSSWIGPAIVAAITDSSGEIRLGLIYLLVALVVSTPVVMLIDATKGKADAIKLTKSAIVTL